MRTAWCLGVFLASLLATSPGLAHDHTLSAFQTTRQAAQAQAATMRKKK